MGAIRNNAWQPAEGGKCEPKGCDAEGGRPHKPCDPQGGMCEPKGCNAEGGRPGKPEGCTSQPGQHEPEGCTSKPEGCTSQPGQIPSPTHIAIRSMGFHSPHEAEHCERLSGVECQGHCESSGSGVDAEY